MKINIIAKPNTTVKNKTGGWRTFIPKTDFTKCIGCGTCSKVCPESAIQMIDVSEISSKKKPITNFDFCKGCGICANQCPVKAIIMELDKK